MTLLGFPFLLLAAGLLGMSRGTDMTTRARRVSTRARRTRTAPAVRSPVRTRARAAAQAAQDARSKAAAAARAARAAQASRSRAARARAARAAAEADAAAARAVTAARKAKQPTKAVPVSTRAAVPIQPPPWPQVVPGGLPSFPGASWIPDNPPSSDVVARAHALLPVLWRHGQGTFKTEQTGGRWITYRATPMGAKKGVVAFRLASEPKTTPTLVRTAAPAAKSPTSPAPSMGLPTLRRGPPWRNMAETRIVQQKLGLNPDGKYGKNTEAAVRSYQSSKGLVADGVVGRNTWAALMGTTRA